ncbi:MAG TPA: PIN domain-containing protein [Caulobacteraceae bacterium]|nr:PIN domain-containing protein [Caulobacteraceae bacterium]
MIQIDTHVVIWLAERRESQLSPLARRLVERESLEISPMVVMELETLRERGRLRNEPARLIAVVTRDFGLTQSEVRFDALIDAARTFAWTRDPFDRLIVANAIADDTRLITADEIILANFKDAVW